MKVVTWNVNSIRSRLDRLLAWLDAHRPDVLCLQELKATEDVFPLEAIQSAGYRAAVYGQKTYNGVAILSKTEPQDVRIGFDDDVDDPQARLISADLAGIRVLSAYVPNGSTVGSDKYAYKLAWMQRLRDLLARQFDPSQPLVLCGDFNVARDDLDVANPEVWADSVLCVDEVRARLDSWLQWGLIDNFREQHPEGSVYSWWDYRRIAFPKNDGLRIDYVLATRPLADTRAATSVDREERKGQKPSDHAPVVSEFDWNG